MSATKAGALMLVRYRSEAGVRWGMARDDTLTPLAGGLDDLLGMGLEQARTTLGAAARGPAVAPHDVELLAPVDGQEVWAAGVTYERSRDGRIEESGQDALYDIAYRGARPELFFKSTAARVVAPGDAVGVRKDSTWDVPEPEIVLILNRDLDLFGFTIGNDVSSRSIEGENALFLPQAKIYERACSLGPGIWPVWEVGEGPFTVELEVARDHGVAFAATTSSARMRRTWSELAAWLGAALRFPVGAALMTGTGIVPGADFSLRAGDMVTVRVEGLGELSNPVVDVGREPAEGRNGTPDAPVSIDGLA